jgi:hypothetical protein
MPLQSALNAAGAVGQFGKDSESRVGNSIKFYTVRTSARAGLRREELASAWRYS